MNVIRVHTAVLHILAGLRVELKAGLYSLDNTCSKVGTGVDRARVAYNTIKRHHEKVYNIYDPELSKKMKAKQYVLDFVDSAAENGDIKVFYQPIIRVKTGKICGYEALARWIDSDIGFLSPNDFIPTLEEYHLIHLVDLAIIRNVCKDLRTLIDKDESVVPVSINISRLSFEFDNMYEMVEMYRKQYNIERNMIDIEITESALNEESDVLLTAMKRFKKAGYRVWIDDFGSGYSSLNTLLDYDFDVLKLDLEFLRTYDRTKSAAKLIRHIVEGAREVGVIPLQEGVESNEHFELLKEIECDKAQGFFFAKPMALEESRKYTREKGLLWE